MTRHIISDTTCLAGEATIPPPGREWGGGVLGVEEPAANPGKNPRAVMIDWLFEIRAACEYSGATAPISVSASHSTEHLRLLEPISDVLTFHPYYAWNLWVPEKQQYTDSLDAAVGLSAEVGKPLCAFRRFRPSVSELCDRLFR